MQKAVASAFASAWLFLIKYFCFMATLLASFNRFYVFILIDQLSFYYKCKSYQRQINLV